MEIVGLILAVLVIGLSVWLLKGNSLSSRRRVKYKITPTVQQQVQKLFTPSQVSDVLAALSKTHLPFFRETTADVERIHLAILYLSGGNLEHLLMALEQARSDWRDVLMCADLANSNWADVLRSRGIHPTLLP